MTEPTSLERSEELRSIVARYWAAFQRGDAEAVIARHSAAHGVTVVGTDPSEFIDDPDRLVAYLREQFADLGDWPVGDAQIDAWVEGSIGWAVVRSTVGPGEQRRGLRVSLVFRLERDDWRIVHEHWSLGAPNEEIFGIRLIYAIEEIARAVESDRPDLGELAAADGTVTLVFTDIEDSTLLTASYGDRAWLEVLRAHNAIVEEATEGQSGTVVQRVGDGYMLAFSSARRAIRAALSIQSRIAGAFDDPGSPIRVRIGIHTGDVLREADEFFGQAVNYAARVAAAGSGGETVVSRLVHDLVADDHEFAFGDPRQVAMKGFPGDQAVYPVTAVPRSAA